MVLSKKKREWWETGFSATAQGVFDLMPTDPLPALKTIMATAIDALVDTGDFADLNQIIVLLDTEANSLIDWTGTQNALAVNSPTFDAFDFWTFNGTTQYINLQLAPSAYVQATQDDIDTGVWVVESVNPGATGMILGVTDGTEKTNYFQSAGVDLRANLNSNATGIDATESFFASNSLYSIIRTVSTDFEMWKNGVKFADETPDSTGLPTIVKYFGARNNGGTANLHFDGNLSLFYVKKSRGNLAFYNIINTMVTDIQALG